jgi:LPXTG-motif cell wall-anchored protein
MKTALSIALLAGGVVLIVYGFNSSNSIGSDFSRFFTGSPTDQTIWLMIGGVVLAVLGTGGLLFRSKSA